jgi:hypothetical protein
MRIDNDREFFKSGIIEAANETLGYKHKENRRERFNEECKKE